MDEVEKERYMIFWNGKRAYNSTDLSGELERVSLPILGFPLNVQQWRHINNLLRDRYIVTDLSSPLLNQAVAYQDAHTEAIHDRVYAVSSEDIIARSQRLIARNILLSVASHLVRHISPTPPIRTHSVSSCPDPVSHLLSH